MKRGEIHIFMRLRADEVERWRTGGSTELPE